MRIESVDAGPVQACEIVAELSNNANGKLDNALRLLDEVRECGVSAAKIQTYLPSELVALRGDGPAPEPWGSMGWTMRSLYEKAATPTKWIPKLFAHADDIGLPLFSSVFGTGSLALLEALDCPRYKLASLDYGKRALLNAVCETGKPIIRSCNADRAPKPGKVRQRLVPGIRTWLYTWLYCPPGYPQPNARLGQIRAGRYDGYSYHGTDPLVPVLAVAHGAKMVEFHVQLDDCPSELEANVSLTISQTADVVAMIRRAEKAVG